MEPSSETILYETGIQSIPKSWPKRLCDGENGHAQSKLLEIL